MRSLPNSRAPSASADLTRCRSTRSCTACRCSTPSCKRPGRTRSLRCEHDDPRARHLFRTKMDARLTPAHDNSGAPMEKLIITVACDSRTSYPHNHLCPSQEDIPGVAQQYIDAVNAGAAIAHIHGRRTLEETIQADGRQVSRIYHDDWKRLQDAIMNKVDPIMQFGVASARIEEKIKLMELGPDMMAVCFNAHDEYFQPEPSLPPKRMMAIHPVEELMAYAKAAEEHKVKLECECFTTGAFWHLEFVRKQGYLRENTYTTLFIGWPGGTWTPPTERALQFMVDNLPQNCIWNVSVMNPQKQWPILSLAVALGGHVRVGYEDNPYIAPGEFAKSNAVLVERMASIARGLGREIATPDEARKILGLTRAQ
ncbi:MAG: 3-keto-5-aminohexanoate cleavage protein [Alphaproteobacteria bacterium]|nr:MAG: 3-keto-5-aminohexanoate cleavage protein [Alphaproteobacteria bacterium]